MGKAYRNDEEPDKRRKKYNGPINENNYARLMRRQKRRKDTQKEQHTLYIEGVR